MALSKNQDLNTLDKFEAEKITVLGGDVYALNDDKLESHYDNWYCGREPNESLDSYVTRNIYKASTYIFLLIKVQTKK